VFDSSAARQREVWHYVRLLEIVSYLPADVADSKGIDIRETAREAVPNLAALGRISNFAAARHDSIFGVLFFTASWLLLIDFQILSFMEVWHRRCGHRVRSWFDAIGELEATACLANVTHDHPDWSFPRVDRSETRIVATDFGHPLLTNNDRVNNTVEVGPAGRFLLVSGSNMSGKSTLLRSLGVSAVLAQMGGPVAAGELRLPPLTIATSMRVHDSLEDGVSFFMAELKRLKEIVDMSRAQSEGDERVLLFLLDEILQGTNSVERHIAVIRVLRHLVGQGAMGAISTHDLDLARSEDLAPHCDAVYFREQIDKGDGTGKMTFDYRIREGVATTTNALRLLELVGLSEVDDD
jgi:DNA mismatch repair ATPase MutS